MVTFAGKSFDFVVWVISDFSQCFKYTYVACILVCLYLIWFVYFYGFMDKGVFRTCQTSEMEIFARWRFVLAQVYCMLKYIACLN